MDLTNTSEAIRALAANVERVITGKRRVVELATCTLFAGQHLLIEDVPGVGKTMLARAIARSIDGTFKRVQGTSDLMPSDVTGSSVFDQTLRAFTFVPGPVFTHVLLVDEINRATPKTQSALLEVMEEGSVSMDGNLHEVPRPFFVIATRNPIEHYGTFPLPEAELDRFGLSINVGYPDADAERRIVIAQMDSHPLDDLEPVTEPDSVLAHQAAIRTVHIDPAVLDYALTIVRSTRGRDDVVLGASPRASLAIVRVSQALALLRGRDHVWPDDVKALAPTVLGHRILLSPDRPPGRSESAAVVQAVLRDTPAPVLPSTAHDTGT